MSGIGALERARAAAVGVAAEHAAAVDRDARFAVEAITALRQQRLLGIMVPRELGGEGAGMAEVMAICHALAQACASTAMTYAMHQIQVACLVDHGQGAAWHRRFMEEVVERQLLLASATSEIGIGGDARSSTCAIEPRDGRFLLDKRGTVISYGGHADALLVTARRDPTAPSSDQVIAIILKDDVQLERTSGWDTLGMRGASSNGHHLKGRATVEQVMPVPFGDIQGQTMQPVSHLVWSALWTGIATEAVSRAQAFIRAEARKRPGAVPHGAERLAETVAMLQEMRGLVADGLARYEAMRARPDAAGTLSFTVAMNNLKLSAAQMVVRVVERALLTIGLAGYRNDTPFSVARHLRDSYSCALMISNDRIIGNNANLLLAHRHGTGLFD